MRFLLLVRRVRNGVCQGEASARYAVRNQGSEFFQLFEAFAGLLPARVAGGAGRR